MDLSNEAEIRQLLENWCIWRDTGDFERLRSTWHDEGRMWTTWSRGTADDFIALASKAFERGADISHMHGGSDIRINGDRAVAHSRAILSQRASVHGVACDVGCFARFYDLIERRGGRWAFLERRPLYDRDWLHSIDGSPLPTLDPDLLARFPAGYRHFGYVLTQAGMEVRTDLPGRCGPDVRALYERGDAWLAGGALD